jgi:hypothetical protein
MGKSTQQNVADGRGEILNEIKEVLYMPKDKKTESEHIGGELAKEMETYGLYDKVNLL